MIRAILSLFFVAALPTESQAQDTNREIERIYYINESVEICQPPTELVHLPGVRGEPYFLKYSSRDLSETYLTIVIWGKDIPSLEINPGSYFTSDNMCMAGVVSYYNGQKQVVIRKPSQLIKK